MACRAAAGLHGRQRGASEHGQWFPLKTLHERLRDSYRLGVMTNDNSTRRNADFPIRHSALTEDRIIGMEARGWPHAAIREDTSPNMYALETLLACFSGQLAYLLMGNRE